MRSKCYKIESLISDYIDGTLSEQQTANVASHIRSCRSCKREVADLKKTQHLLKNFYVEPEASDIYYTQFATRLQKRIEQSAPTALHQRFAAATTRLGWQLLTQVYRYADRFRPSRFIPIRQHALPYYVLALAMTVLIATPFLLTQVSMHNNGEHTHLPSAGVQPAVTLAIQQDKTTTQSVGIRRNVSSERTTETPLVDSGSDVWKFTDEPMVDGYILTTLHKDSSDTMPSVHWTSIRNCSLTPNSHHKARFGHGARAEMYSPKADMHFCCCEVLIQDSKCFNSINGNGVNSKVFHKNCWMYRSRCFLSQRFTINRTLTIP